MNSYSDCSVLLLTDCTHENYPPCRKPSLCLSDPPNSAPALTSYREESSMTRCSLCVGRGMWKE